ncbi:MAG: hypothetical protein ACHQ3O_13700, partial [Candidatus Limnocylindria bacterium]
GCASAGGECYAPGIGEIMSDTQMRLLKLWLAGEAQNWDLAAYEVDEIEEGFADAAHFHPEHKSAPRPLTKMIPDFAAGPLHALRGAIDAKSPRAFETAYDSLTQGCNGCHVEAGFGFNVVVRPSGNPYTNQRFDPPR